jgi:galactonate dehydratase
MISVPPGPGLGMELQPDLEENFTVSRRFSDIAAYLTTIDFLGG